MSQAYAQTLANTLGGEYHTYSRDYDAHGAIVFQKLEIPQREGILAALQMMQKHREQGPSHLFESYPFPQRLIARLRPRLA